MANAAPRLGARQRVVIRSTTGRQRLLDRLEPVDGQGTRRAKRKRLPRPRARADSQLSAPRPSENIASECVYIALYRAAFLWQRNANPSTRSVGTDEADPIRRIASFVIVQHQPCKTAYLPDEFVQQLHSRDVI